MMVLITGDQSSYQLIKRSHIMKYRISTFLCVIALFCTGCKAGQNRFSEAKAGQQKSNEGAVNKGEVLERSYFFEEAGKDISYTLYVPTTYDEGKKLPLVVLLHGLGSNPKQIIRYKGITTEAETRGYMLVAPYGYNERGWYGSRGKGKGRNRLFRESKDDPENLGELSEKDVLNVLNITRSEFTIDEDRIFILGHSMGGGGALHLASVYPDIWAGLGALSPAFYAPLSKLEKMKHLSSMMVTGTNDRLVPVKNVRLMAEKMKALKMDYHYKEIEGGNHFFSITRNPQMIAEVFDFFDKHKRKSTQE